MTNMTHQLIEENVVSIDVNGTSVVVTIHDSGELDFENYEHLTDSEFIDVIEYVENNFPMEE